MFHLSKIVYVTPACAPSQFVQFFMRVMCSMGNCKWKLEFADWATLRAKFRPVRLFALVRLAEVEEFVGYKNVFTTSTFAKRLISIDMTGSVTGLV